MTDARTLTQKLGGHWYGAYGVARCTAHDDQKPSLTLANGADGRLLLHCKTGCQFVDVLGRMRERGLLDGQCRPEPTNTAEIARRRAQDGAKARKRERQALACLNETLPPHGTIVEIYLREARGITCPLPDTLRFHPACWHGATASRRPAMVARIEGLPRLAVHRTYLRSDGSGKTDVEPNKAMLGKVVGGAVRLTDTSGPLVVAEGIETALSLASGLLRGPSTIWAALSASGVAGLRLPDGVPHHLIIAPDSDDKGTGQNAAYKLAERASALGWAVSLFPAPTGQDWNDVLRLKGDPA